MLAAVVVALVVELQISLGSSWTHWLRKSSRCCKPQMQHQPQKVFSSRLPIWGKGALQTVGPEPDGMSTGYPWHQSASEATFPDYWCWSLPHSEYLIRIVDTIKHQAQRHRIFIMCTHC